MAWSCSDSSNTLMSAMLAQHSQKGNACEKPSDCSRSAVMSSCSDEVSGVPRRRSPNAKSAQAPGMKKNAAPSAKPEGAMAHAICKAPATARARANERMAFLTPTSRKNSAYRTNSSPAACRQTELAVASSEDAPSPNACWARTTSPAVCTSASTARSHHFELRRAFDPAATATPKASAAASASMMKASSSGVRVPNTHKAV